MKDVDVIIVSHNTRDDLAVCLESLHAPLPECVSHVTIVDNGSSDGTAEMVRERWPGIQVIALAENLGFGAANNVALRQSQARYALLLNSDTRVPAGAVDTLRERLLARGAVAAGPHLVDGNGRPEVSFGPMLTPARELIQRFRVRVAATPRHWASGWVERQLAEERFTDWVSGACLLLDAKAAAAAGLFDERFFLYEEDVDLCAALRRRGGRVLYTPAATVVHYRGRSVAKVPAASSSSHYDRSHLAFYQKHAPHWLPWLKFWKRLRGRGLE